MVCYKTCHRLKYGIGEMRGVLAHLCCRVSLLLYRHNTTQKGSKIGDYSAVYSAPPQLTAQQACWFEEGCNECKHNACISQSFFFLVFFFLWQQCSWRVDLRQSTPLWGRLSVPEKRDHQVGQSTTCRVPSVDLVLVQSNDTTTYDDAVDAIEPDESSGLHIPIQKVTAATCTTAFVSSEVDCRDLSVCAGRRTPCIPPVCRRMLVLG